MENQSILRLYCFCQSLLGSCP